MDSASRFPLSRRGFLGGASAITVSGKPAPRPAQEPAGATPGPRSTPKPVTIGIVGGRFGASFQWHLDPLAHVVAVCDIAAGALDRLASAYRCDARYRDFGEFLRHPRMDAVGVFTPAPLHAGMATEAMRAGKHVISAVPAGLTEEELAGLLETVRETGMKYMMAETSYYRPEIITCREWARAGRFGALFYSEAEYHHEGLLSLMFDDQRRPTWRHGFPPMLYPTHCTGMVVPVTGERLVEVQALGWGDRHEILRTNQYRNPFWNTTGFFKTSGGHSARVTVFWHVAAGVTERAQFFGDQLSFVMERPEYSANVVMRIVKDGRVVLDPNGYPEGEVAIDEFGTPDYFDRLPEPMRVKTGHGNSHTFLTHEFVRAVAEDRYPAINIWEAVAYTLPGIVAHQSALRGGECLKIKDYGAAPA